MKEDCLFELSYIKHEEERINSGHTIASERIRIGKLLGNKFPVDADYVIPVPETAVFNAIGYHLATGIPFCFGIYKKRPKTKTLFINDRENLINDLMIPIPEIIASNRIVIIDETIISGLSLITTLKKIKENSPKEVHLRIAIKPMQRRCPSSDFGESWRFLINEVDDLCDYFGVDSFKYLDPEDFSKTVNCTYCFGGKYDKSKMVRTSI